MADLYEIKEAEERVILIAVSVNEEDDTAASLDELEELVKTAGAFMVGKVIRTGREFIREPIWEKAR